MAETRSAEVVKALHHANRYSESSIGTLEAHLSGQMSKAELNDVEANLALLKLYQFFPSAVKTESVAGVLVKALMSLPHEQFGLARFLLSEEVVKDPVVAALLKMNAELEKGEYAAFWTSRKGDAAGAIGKAVGFDEAVRAFISTNVAGTFQSAPAADVAAWVGLSVGDLSKISAEWKVEGDVVKFPLNASNQAENKKIQPNFQFHHLGKLLNAVGAK